MPHMIGTIIGLVLLVALLGVVFYSARILLPVISPILRILIILLVAIVTMYVIIVLLGGTAARSDHMRQSRSSFASASVDFATGPRKPMLHTVAGCRPLRGCGSLAPAAW
jgi:hypothetical protein